MAIETRYLRASDGTGAAVLAHVTANRAAGATTLKVDNVNKWPAYFIATTGTLNANGYIVESGKKEFKGRISGTDILIDSWEPGFTDNGNNTNEVVIVKQTVGWANLIQEALAEAQKFMTPTGTIAPFAGRTAPSDWLLCAGQAISRTTYATLFSTLTANLGAATISIAAPGVVTAPGHGLATGDLVYFTTTGVLPSGLAPNTAYFAIVTDANNFRLAASFANAVAGTAITTTGSQSGVHTVRFAPYGIGDGTTTFNLPDLRGRAIAGKDDMNGTAANRLTNQSGGVKGNVIGAVGGAETHTLSAAQMPAHTHAYYTNTISPNGWTGSYGAVRSGGSGYSTWDERTDSQGGGQAHNNVQPTMTLNYIIKV